VQPLTDEPSRASDFFSVLFSNKSGQLPEKLSKTLLQHAALGVYTGRKESKNIEFLAKPIRQAAVLRNWLLQASAMRTTPSEFSQLEQALRTKFHS
jgi:hypothetical protein